MVRKLTSPILILALLCTAYTLSFFHRVCPSVLAADLMRDLSLDAAGFSAIGSATMLGYAITQIPSGIIADIVGGRRTLAAYQAAAGTLCIAFTLCSGLIPAVACRFLMGLVLAGNVPAYKILASAVPANRYAQYSSILTGCSAIGTLLAASPLVALTGATGWRLALGMAGTFTVLLGALVFMLLDDRDCRSGDTYSVRQNIAALRDGIAAVAKMKNFWLIFIWFLFIIGNMFTLLATWWGSFLMQAGGLSREQAGLSISIMSLGPLPFLLVFPWLSEEVFHSRRVFLLGAALLDTAALAWICLHGETPFSFAELTACGLAIGVASSSMGCFSFTMVKESVPPSALASACGFLNCSAPVASAVMQAAIGWIISAQINGGATAQSAYQDAFLLLLGTSLAAVAAALVMKDTLKADRP